MPINKISANTIAKMKRKSILVVGKTPTLTSEKIRESLIKPIIDEGDSIVTEINRIVEEINEGGITDGGGVSPSSVIPMQQTSPTEDVIEGSLWFKIE